MAQSIIEEIGQILPPSQNLADTLARAADYATQQSHPEVTLEHLLLALTEDPDAALVLTLSKVEIEQLKGDVSTHLGRLEDRSATNGAVGISANLRQVLEAAAAAARGRRNAIDGAIVLAAIVGDGRSTAAHLLRAHGLTFEEAIKALQQAAQAAEAEAAEAAAAEASRSDEAAVVGPPATEAEPNPTEHPVAAPVRHPAGATADEILASARQRVQGRFAHGLPDANAPLSGNGAAHTDVSGEHETLPGESEEPHPAPTRTTGLPDWHDDPAMPAPAPFSAEHEVAEPGPRPAPPAKRPLPPGAIRPQAPVREPEAQSSGPPPSQDRRVDESAIDEVLASIRKVGKGPTDQPFSPQPPPPAPQRSTVPNLPHHPQPAGASAAPAGGPQPGSARPSDRDFFGPPGSSGQAPTRANAAAPQMPPPPPPPGRYVGPPRAPLPGLPPTHGAPPAAAPPGPAPRQQPRPDGAAGGPPPQMPPMRAPGVPPGPARSAPSAGVPQLPSEAPARHRSPELSLGEMVENIPRVMRVGIPVLVEARVARSEVKALADGLQGGGAVWRHELTVTKAMSVRLRAPDGGFFIETSSPETQWIENTLGLITDDYASWRWSVTPKDRGKKRLQLIISARTVGTDGLAAETALPDQVVSVKVRVNYARTARKIGGWALAAIIGGVLARFGEDLPAKFMSLVGTIMR